MKSNNSSSAGYDMLVDLKDKEWFERQKIAGRITAETLALLKNLVLEKTDKTMIELSEIAEEFILSHEGCTPTFKGYKGFPAAVCISINRSLVHAIPNSYKLQEGDIVKFDLGVTYQGAIGDAAITVIYGEPKSAVHEELLEVCEEALYRGIKAVDIGKQIGCIGNAIYKFVSSTRFKVVTSYGGHLIDTNRPHAEPFIANKAKSDEGIRIQAGMVLAIEPLVTIGDPTTTVGADGWTVSTNGVNSHYENSIFVGEDKVYIMTELNE